VRDPGCGSSFLSTDGKRLTSFLSEKAKEKKKVGFQFRERASKFIYEPPTEKNDSSFFKEKDREEERVRVCIRWYLGK